MARKRNGQQKAIEELADIGRVHGITSRSVAEHGGPSGPEQSRLKEYAQSGKTNMLENTRFLKIRYWIGAIDSIRADRARDEVEDRMSNVRKLVGFPEYKAVAAAKGK